MANSEAAVRSQNQHACRTLEPDYQLTQDLLRCHPGTCPGRQTIANRLGHGKTNDALTESRHGYGPAAIIGVGGTYSVLADGGSTAVYGYGHIYGVKAVAIDDQSEGLYAFSPNVAIEAYGGYGVYAHGPDYGVYASAPNNYAVYAGGNFAATGTKSAVVALPDDRVVSLYAVESPENWFEDFGSGELKNGVAAISLDSTFALTVSAEAGYHVFLTPNGDCEGLYVASKTETGFEVHELRGGKSNVTFDYRIIAKRKGLESLRMEKVSVDHEVAESIRQQMAERPSHTPRLVLPKAIATGALSSSGSARLAAPPPPVPGVIVTKPGTLAVGAAAPAIVLPKPPAPRSVPTGTPVGR